MCPSGCITMLYTLSWCSINQLPLIALADNLDSSSAK
jgi:hypothetical protein